MKSSRLFINNRINFTHHARQMMLKRSNASGVTPESIKGQKGTLSNYLRAKIKSCGPITVAEYMKEALTHPTAGYYMSKDVFGADGDFITSPEISQLFGEMIGVWTLAEWRKISRDKLQLVELGPGRGTLSNHVLKVFKQFRATDKLSIHLVEVSPALAKIQSEKLCSSSKDIAPDDEKTHGNHYKQGVTEEGLEVFWYYSVKDIPKKFSVFIAHEFFDALPIHKFQKRDDVWHEVFIDIDPTDDKKFRYVASPSPTLTSKLFVSNDETRDHVEISPDSLSTVDYLSSFIKENGGFALIIDYGHNGEKTDTFRAFRKHEQQDPLDNPGTADLTADVDFSMLKKIAIKDDRSIVFGPVNQRQFLLQLGIDIRLSMLSKNLSDSAKNDLQSGYNMIMDEDKMGTCFKVLALFPSVLRDHLKMWPICGFFEETTSKRSNKRDK